MGEFYLYLDFVLIGLLSVRNFTQTTLGQIKTVYPLAYEIKQDKLFIDYKNDYHMVISANIEQVFYAEI